MNNRTWGIVAIVLSIMFGSTYSIFSKFLLQWTIPETLILLSQICTVVAAVVFFGFFPEVKHMYKFPNKKIAIMVVVAIFNAVLATLFYMKGLSETLATNAIVAARMSSIFMGIIGFIRLKEKISLRWIVGTSIMFFGIFYITSKGFVEGFSLDTGVLYVCLAALCSAMGHSIFKKYLEDIDVELAIFIRNGVGVIFFLLLVPYLFQIDHNVSVGLRPDTWMYFLGLALIPIFFAQYLRYSGLQHIPASEAGSLNLLSPLFGVMLAYTFLGEPLGRYHLVGGVCLVGGIGITMYTTKQQSQNSAFSKRFALFRGIKK